jgi:hypothetical protein
VAESVGLCARCAFASPQAGARGSRFWRCRRADADPAYPRYPALPVLRCAGFEADGKLAGDRRAGGEPGPDAEAAAGAAARPRERGKR